MSAVRDPSKAIRNRPIARLTSIDLVFAAAIAVATTLTFLPSLHNGFVNCDDPSNIVDNPHIYGLSWGNVQWMFTTFHLGPYQPLSWLSLAADYSIWGLDPFGFHMTNLIVHVAVSVSFLFLTRKVLSLASGDAATNPTVIAAWSALSAVVFAIHPLRVESVAWATERRDVLSGLWAVWAVWGYLRAVAPEGPGRQSLGWLVASLVCFAVSLLAKASALALPAVLVVLDVYPLGRLSPRLSEWFTRDARRVWLEKLPYVVSSVVFGAVALHGQRVAGALSAIGPLDRLVIAGYAAAFYVVKLLLPLRLSPLYELPTPAGLWSFQYVAGAAATIAVCVAVWCLRRRAPALLAAWTIFLLVLAPFSGLAQSGQQIAADRYTYLPCLSFAVLAGGIGLWAVSARAASRASSIVPAIVLIGVASALLGARTWRQSKLWHDSDTLWRHAVALDRNSSWALNYLARAEIEADELEFAQTHLMTAVRLRSDNFDAHNNLGVVFRRLGDPVAAKHHYEEALRLRPYSGKFAYNLGFLLSDAKLLEGTGFVTGEEQWHAAAAWLGQALAAQPNDANTLNTLGVVTRRLGQLDDALIFYRRAIQIDPSLADARYNLAIVLVELGRDGEAREQYQFVLQLQPGHAGACNNLAMMLERAGRDRDAANLLETGLSASGDHPILLHRLSWLLATSAEPAVRDGKRAVALAERLHAATSGKNADALDVLAAAYAELGRFEDAARTSERAATLAGEQGRDELAEQISARTELYHSGQPFRTPR